MNAPSENHSELNMVKLFVTVGPSVLSSMCHSKGLNLLTRNSTTLTPVGKHTGINNKQIICHNLWKQFGIRAKGLRNKWLDWGVGRSPGHQTLAAQPLHSCIVSLLNWVLTIHREDNWVKIMTSSNVLAVWSLGISLTNDHQEFNDVMILAGSYKRRPDLAGEREVSWQGLKQVVEGLKGGDATLAFGSILVYAFITLQLIHCWVIPYLKDIGKPPGSYLLVLHRCRAFVHPSACWAYLRILALFLQTEG